VCYARRLSMNPEISTNAEAQLELITQIKNLSFSFMFSFICILVSAGYWLSATLSGLFLVRGLSIAWLMGSLTVLLVPEVWTPAIMGLWAFFFEAIPGIYLYVRERKESL
jgi:uncharacterized membrane protein YagU involved in acid resistance